MTRKLKLTDIDTLNIESNYLEENNISDSGIEKSIHFHNYISVGLAVLVHRDDLNEYKNSNGNKKYSILKGSYTRGRLGNKVQAKLLKQGFIEPVTINGSDCYKFIKNTEPLNVGRVMLAVSVTSNPSVRSDRDYFKEDLRLKSRSKNVVHADSADKSGSADELSEQGISDTVDKLVDKFSNDDTRLMDIIADKMAAILEDNKSKYKYSTENPDPKFFKAQNIYGNYFLIRGGEQKNITKDAFEQAKKILDTTGRLLILGDSGSGKSELAYMLAEYYTGVPMAYETAGDYEHVSAGIIDGRTLWRQSGGKNYGELGAFVNHIIQENKRNPDNINKKYVFIRDEIQSSDIKLLLGNVWNSFNNVAGKSAILPENLLIIFTACRNRDFCIDEQVLRRIEGIELDYIHSKNVKLSARLLDSVSTNKLKIAEEVLELISKINTAENYQVLSVADFFSIINYRRLSSSIKIDNLDYGKHDFERLGEYYDN